MDQLKNINIDYFESKQSGFTLVEILIAILAAAVFSIALYGTYKSQLTSYAQQNRVVEMQQNARGAMDIMVKEIRMAGYDPMGIGGLGITNVQPRDPNNTATIDITFNGTAFLQRAADDGAGANTDSGILEVGETISYSIYDYPVLTPNGIPDLARNNGGGRQLVAESIEVVGFSYAFDANGDDLLDMYLDAGANPVVIWAVDSNGDNLLDINLDTNNDGIIDASDGPGAGNNGLIGGQAMIDSLTGAVIPPVAPANIRAVRISILARTTIEDSAFFDTRTYVAGNKVIAPIAANASDHYKRRLLTTIVECRNTFANNR